MLKNTYNFLMGMLINTINVFNEILGYEIITVLRDGPGTERRSYEKRSP